MLRLPPTHLAPVRSDPGSGDVTHGQFLACLERSVCQPSISVVWGTRAALPMWDKSRPLMNRTGVPAKAVNQPVPYLWDHKAQ